MNETEASNAGREQEIKLELASADDHAALIAALPRASKEKHQRNHYYDLPGHPLRAAGVMLRLRLEAVARDGGDPIEKARITVKEGAVRDGAGLFDSAESEETVAVDLARAVIEGEAPFPSLGGPIIARLAERFGDLAPLARWGTLENRRSVHLLDGTFEVEVDRASYPDGTILHEVELESDDPARARVRLIALLESIPVRFSPSSMSKSERLAHAAGRIGDPEG